MISPLSLLHRGRTAALVWALAVSLLGSCATPTGDADEAEALGED